MERLVAADSHALITAYETKIRKLEERKLSLSERARACGRPLKSFDETLRTACAFLENPYKLWLSENIEDKRTVLRLVFAGQLPYRRKEGFRTAKSVLTFQALRANSKPQRREWWARQDSNLRQHRYERCVLTAELQAPASR